MNSQGLQICEQLLGAGIDLCVLLVILLVLQVKESPGRGDVLTDTIGKSKALSHFLRQERQPESTRAEDPEPWLELFCRLTIMWLKQR